MINYIKEHRAFLTAWILTAVLSMATIHYGFANPLNPNAMSGAIEKSQQIPVDGFMWMEKDGKQYFLSQNGRVLLTGKVKFMDVWTKEKIANAEQASMLRHVNLNDIGFEDAELPMFKVGTGEKRISLFVDPACPHCHEMLSKLDPYSTEYTYAIILLPVMGEQSISVSRQLNCLGDSSPQEAFRILQQKLWKELPTQDCAWEPLQKSVLLAKLLGVTGVPFMIAPDGFMQQGMPKDMEAFLKEHNG
jgi:thiol:disulfide interchange protein DsbC